MTYEDWVDVRFPFDMIDSFRILILTLNCRRCFIRLTSIFFDQGSGKFSSPAFDAAVQRVVDALLPGLTTRSPKESVRMAMVDVTNLTPSTTWWKGLGNPKKPRVF
ncbi:hypothetical protein Tco_0323492 [Tanacetum coccineum]